MGEFLVNLEKKLNRLVLLYVKTNKKVARLGPVFGKFLVNWEKSWFSFVSVADPASYDPPALASPTHSGSHGSPR